MYTSSPAHNHYSTKPLNLFFTVVLVIAMLHLPSSSHALIRTSHFLWRSSSSTTVGAARRPVGRFAASLFLSASASTSANTGSNSSGGNGKEDIQNRLQQVRTLMQQKALDAIIVPTDDPHLSEYIAPYFARREFISGFTGSAGVAVITKTHSLLFTDGRYHKQAELELPSDWVLMKRGLKDVPSFTEFLMNNLTAGAKVGIDPFVHSAAEVQAMKKAFETKQIDLTFFPEQQNLIDQVWAKGRPTMSSLPIRSHPLQYAGQTVANKLQELRKLIQENQAQTMIITALDEIMWLFNIRGRDIPFNPVAVCYAAVTSEAAFLFIDPNKVSTEMRELLQEEGIHIRPYDTILSFVEQRQQAGRVWIDPKTVNAAISNQLTSNKFEKTSPIILMKALKNSEEMEGMKQCHLRDGAAFAEFLAWLEDHLQQGHSISEYDIDLKLTASRASCGTFLEPSFSTIAGVNENAAIIHYRAPEVGCKILTKNDLLLLDSGGQYLDGTTDVTRTFHFGTPTDFQVEMYTRVLKGHISIDKQIFPVGTPGCFLDILSRQHLWQAGRNFIHGTGHGVGAALNVHEGPHRIGPVLDAQGLFPGMIVSNEPGYYEENAFGIRIENLLAVVEKKELGQYAGKTFVGFEKLTHIPIQRTMIKKALLTQEEIDWINTYHQEVYQKIVPLVTSERAKKWLLTATSPL